MSEKPKAAPATTPTGPPTPDVYLLYCGPINEITVPKITNLLATAVLKQVTRLHFSIQSSGGTVADAVYLYNVLKGLPLELITYNDGQISSAAVLVYLAGKTRVVSNHALFMVHRTYLNNAGGTKRRMRHSANYLEQEDQRTDAIYSEYLKLPKDAVEELEHRDVYFNAEEAVKYGFATRRGDFVAPFGAQYYSVFF